MTQNTHILEITSACNLRCPYCIVNHGMTRPQAHMPFDNLIRILDEIAELGADQEVYLYNYGEPLLHPEISRIVQTAAERSLRTQLSTNCSDLGNLGPQLARAGLTILMVDLDGVTQRAHGTYRVGSNVAEVMREIAGMMAALRSMRHSTVVVLQTIVHRRNYGELDSIRKFCRSVGIRYIAWKSLAVDLGISLSVRGRTIARNRLVPPDPRFDRYSGLISELGAPCAFGDMNGVVLSNGDYTVCTHDPDGSVVLGNVFRSGYRALRTTAFEHLRDRISKRALPPCGSCSMSTHLGYIEDLKTGRELDRSINFSPGGMVSQLEDCS